METVTHHGRTTAYERHDRGGDGPGLCLVHGSGGSRGVWRAQARIADHGPVVRLDLSGHGDSADIEAEAGWSALSAYASDVIAVAEATDCRVIVGNSLGGAVALHVALYRSFAPDALVLVGTGAKLAVLDDLLRWLEADFERAVDFLHEPGRLFADPDPDLERVSREAMFDCGRAVTYRDFLSCHRFDVRDDLHRIDVPCLAIVGETDRLTPPWYHEYLAEHIPDGTWTAIPDAAHLVMLERPDPFNDALIEFLDERVRNRA